MLRIKSLKSLSKDHLGALMLVVLGMGVLTLGLTYRMGTLNRMGAGFIPVVLGLLMAMVGIAIAVTSTPASAATAASKLVGHGDGRHTGPEWRGWLCILGGVLAFVLFGQYGGLVPATFASVFISALGDRNNTVRSAAVLASIMVVFGAIVFHYGLKLPLPLFSWG